MTGSDRRSRLADWTLVACFFVAISLPLAAALFGLAPGGRSSEKRDLAPLPPLAPSADEVAKAGGKLAAWRETLAAFPAGFDEFHDDRFGFRPELIRLHNLFKARVLGVSPSDQAVIGRDGWLFYAGQQALDYYRASESLALEDLAEWKRRLEAPAEWLDDRGIEFVFYFAPDKATIYPEELPYFVRRIGERSRLDQFLEYMRAHSTAPIVFVDPRADFRAAKSLGPLYRKTDTHWNQLGAFVAYSSLMRALVPLFPAIEPLEQSDFDRHEQLMDGGDIALLMDLSDVFRERAIQLAPKTPWPYRKDAVGMHPSNQPDVERSPDRQFEEQRRLPMGSVQDDAPDLPRLVLFRDSYGTELIPFLAASVQRGAYYWQFIVDPKVIVQEDPQVVVQEIGERVLMFDTIPAVLDEEIAIDFERRRAFRAARETLFSLDAALDPGVAELRFAQPEELEAPGNGDGLTRFRLENGPLVLELTLSEQSPRDVHARLEVETPADVELVVRAGGEVLAERTLALRHDIVYADVPAARSGTIELQLSGPSGELVLRGLELRR